MAIYVESLTDYVGRLVLAYGVMTHKLVAEEVLPLFEQEDLQNYDFPRNRSCSINGIDKWANDWVRVVGTLTQRNDLEFLTILPWMNVLSPRGLLRRTIAWCPECYAEWHQYNQIIYTPLLWALEVITHCPHHHTSLNFLCPHCQKTIPFLASLSRAGYCPHCLHWLGLSDKKEMLANSN